MKRILTILLLNVLASVVSAQGDYTSLWKQFEKAQEKDQPKTALAAVRKIGLKAEKEKHYGQLFAALFSERSLLNEISPDSVAPMNKRLEDRETEFAKTDLVAANIYRIALQKAKEGLVDSLLFHTNDDVVRMLTQENSVSRYMPFIEKESDSKYFHHDIISVIASELSDYEPLIRYYAKTGNRVSACIAAAQYLEDLNQLSGSKKEREACILKADSLINLYNDLPECGALAVRKYYLLPEDAAEKIAWIDHAVSKWPSWKEINELKNYRTELTNQQINISGPEVLRTAEDAKFTITARNISSVTITATPITGLSARIAKEMDLDAKGMKALKPYLLTSKAISVKKDCSGHKDFENFTDSISLGKLPLGLYLVEAICDGKAYTYNKTIITVSDLKVIALAQGKSQIRYAVVDATTGQPVAGASLHLIKNYNDQETIVSTNDKGEYVLDYAQNEKPNRVYATTEIDKAQTSAYLSAYFNTSTKNQDTNQRAQVFTDRALYRPGQTVHVSVLAYDVLHQDETTAGANRKLTLTLKNPDYKDIDTVYVTTDEYGVASTDFILPERTKNGAFIIDVNNRNSKSIRVEEYVRPTYEVTIEKPEIAYKDGDTITIVGTAKTYSGIAVSNAKVVYSVKRDFAWWWRSNSSSKTTLISDTIHTDASGRFAMRVPMVLPENYKERKISPLYWCPPMFYSITTNAVVTDIAGESHEASLSLPLSNRETALSCDIKDKYLKEEGKNIEITFTRRNNAGTEIEGKVAITIDGEKMPEADCGKSYVIPLYLPSKSHSIRAICGNDTIVKDFVLFSLEDKTPVVETKDWWYQSSDVFPASIQFGTSDRNVHAVYSMFANNKVIESGVLALDSSLITRKFEYKEEYGDGICYTVAWVRDGRMYSHCATIKRALPDKTLQLTWSTFRNKLLPGQKEEWTLSVTDKEGKAANANVMAVLYDKSLDALKKHSWSFTDPRGLYIGTHNWNCTNWGSTHISCENFYKPLNYRNLTFSHFDHGYISCPSFAIDEVCFLNSAPRTMRTAKTMKLADVAESKAVAFALMTKAPVSADSYATKENGDTDIAEEDNIEVRTNLSETAFFMPNLRTNADGLATLSFTLPESVTTWKFMAFANDKDIRYGMMTDQIVAQKQLMIQPRLPRFLREGDVTDIPATISNITEKDIAATVKFTILDAKTEKVLSTQSKKITVKAGKSEAVSFPYDSKNQEDKSIIVRYTVSGKSDDGTFSDGEQKDLPIISQKELMVNTQTFILTEVGKEQFDLRNIMPSTDKKHLTVEYTDSPEWLMIKALPSISKADNENAISLVSTYYANSIASGIVRSNPGIRKAVDEWKDKELSELFDSISLGYRNNDALLRLSNLQNHDGSWSWWKGMDGSTHMTVQVLKTLLRLNLMMNDDRFKKQNEKIVSSAFRYLDKQTAKEVAEMKKDKNRYLPYYALDYLYCRAIAKASGIKIANNISADYLTKLVPVETRYDDMQTKAQAAIILAFAGNKGKASEFIKSIVEHTVYREDLGRYFDSHRASYSWCDYKIPTQVSVIEALKLIDGKNSAKDIADMKRWLLQSKRTQSWDTPINAINAIYAFLCPSQGTSSSLRNGVPADIALGKKRLEAKEYTAALGYVKMSKDISSDENNLSVTKHTEGESWTNVFIEYKQAATNSEEASSGLSITRKIETNGKDLKVGDKVEVTITINADRDYDFVTVTDNRPACLEPVEQVSGYSQGAYRIIRDTKTEYCYNMMRKGTHVIKTSYYVARKGKYTSGTATATCTYSPVFAGRTAGVNYVVK